MEKVTNRQLLHRMQYLTGLLDGRAYESRELMDTLNSLVKVSPNEPASAKLIEAHDNIADLNNFSGVADLQQMNKI